MRNVENKYLLKTDEPIRFYGPQFHPITKEQLYNSSRLCRELGIYTNILLKWRRTKLIPSGRKLKGWRYTYWTQSEVDAMKQYVFKPMVYTKKQLARTIGISDCLLNHFQKMGGIPAPSIPLKAHCWAYTLEEAKEVVDFFNRLKKARKSLFHLESGLREINQPFSYLWYGRKYGLLPVPEVTFGRGKKSRYYTVKQIAEFVHNCDLHKLLTQEGGQ